jgi:hypothetical protein
MAKLRQKLDRAEWAKLTQDRQADYIERNGVYVLDTDDADELRSAYDRQKQELADAKRRLDAIRDVDPEEYQRLKDAADKAARDKEIEKGNFEKLQQQDAQRHADEIKKRDEAAARLRVQLEESLVDGELTRAYAATGGTRPNLFMPAARTKVAAREISGRLRAVVLDDKGEPRLKPNAKTTDDYMGMADLVTEMRNDKEYAAAFPATTTNATTRTTTRNDPVSRSTRDLVDQLAQQVRDGATKVS